MDRQDVFRIVYEEYGTKPEYPNDEWNAVLRQKIMENVMELFEKWNVGN